MLVEFLKRNLPEGKYPDEVGEYLTWDDDAVWRLIKDAQNTDEYANRLVKRRIMKCVYESPTHSEHNDQMIFNFIKHDLEERFGKENLLYDSADKLAHKIPLKHTLESEQAIPIILDHTKTPGTISTESGVIKNMTKPINIWRIYAREEIAEEARKFVEKKFEAMSIKKEDKHG